MTRLETNYNLCELESKEKQGGQGTTKKRRGKGKFEATLGKLRSMYEKIKSKALRTQKKNKRKKNTNQNQRDPTGRK